MIVPASGIVDFSGVTSGIPTAGSLAGAIFWYWVGRRVTKEELCRWVEAHGVWLAMTPEDVHHAVGWFERRGRYAVFLGRLMPVVRTLISVPAGFTPEGLPVLLRAFTPAHLQRSLQEVEVGSPLLIVGFPLGFHDTLHHLPVVRQAAIASSLAVLRTACEATVAWNRERSEPLDVAADACPALAVFGSVDPWTPPADIEALRAAAKIARCRTSVVPCSCFITKNGRPRSSRHSSCTGTIAGCSRRPCTIASRRNR